MFKWFMVVVLLLACLMEAHGQERVGPDVMGATTDLAQDIRREAKELAEWIVAIRRRLHTYPELLYELHNTSAYVREVLDSLDIKYQYPIASVGLVATIGTGEPPVVALRSDMDALPIHEEVESEYKSTIPGKMHACGHDGHMSMLLGAARILKKREKDIKGTIKLIFQPGEEGGAGALQMISEGVMQSPKVQRVFGMHIWPFMKTGNVYSRTGALMAAAGVFEAIFRGKGGHAAVPGAFVDPIVAVSAAITSLQSVVSRDTSTTEPAVASITRVRAGDAFNIIPDVASFGGTLRSFTRAGYNALEARVIELLNHTAQAYRTELTWHGQVLTDECLSVSLPSYMPGTCVYPPVVNDAQTWEFTRKVAGALVGPDRVHDVLPTMGGEDFAYYAERAPASFVFLGSRNEAKGIVHGLHSAKFQLDEDILPIGASLHALWALTSLQELVSE